MTPGPSQQLFGGFLSPFSCPTFVQKSCRSRPRGLSPEFTPRLAREQIDHRKYFRRPPSAPFGDERFPDKLQFFHDHNC
jgi:hypothetical protein